MIRRLKRVWITAQKAEPSVSIKDHGDDTTTTKKSNQVDVCLRENKKSLDKLSSTRFTIVNTSKGNNNYEDKARRIYFSLQSY